MPVSVSIRHVSKAFGEARVIDDISLEIAPGEFIVIVGPSGCGKSTLLRMVAGLETVGSGEIAIDGRVVNDVQPKERNVAMVFQNYALYPHMTVRQNMAYGLALRGLTREQIDERVRTAAQTLGIEKYLARRPSELSGGQRQRVAMGRAIVRDPAVFLFDEPLSNLDAKLRVQMRAQLQALHQRLHTTTLYVTHDQVEAMTLAHRMLVMSMGRAEQVGTPDEVYTHPATTFVAGFIGSPPMNLVAGRVGPAGESLECSDGARAVLSMRVPALAGRDVLLGVRPEHLEVCDEKQAMLTPEVDFVELLGSDLLVYGNLASPATRIAARIEAQRHAALKGRRVRVPMRYEPGRMHLFDPAGGTRIDIDALAREPAVRIA